MAGVYDGQQAAFNSEQSQAILTGQGHVYYALAGVAFMAVLAFVLPESQHWLLYLLIFGFTIGVMVDLYVNGYTH